LTFSTVATVAMDIRRQFLPPLAGDSLPHHRVMTSPAPGYDASHHWVADVLQLQVTDRSPRDTDLLQLPVSGSPPTG
jgi:hypothetical protein